MARRKAQPGAPRPFVTQEEVRRRLKKRGIADVQVRGEDYPKVTERPQASRGTGAQQELVKRLRQNIERSKIDAPQERYKPGADRARPMPKASPAGRNDWARPKIDRTPAATEKVVRFPKATGARRKAL